jgi:membrane protein implicated in regulation of membrane protease activity
MSNRALLVVTILVSCVFGALLCVGIVLPLVFHGVGTGTAVGTAIVGELAAAGSFSAAVAAVGIATHDRRLRERDRKQEQDDADEVEARLIVVEPSRNSDRNQPQVKVENFGTRSVVDVKLTRLEAAGEEVPLPKRRLIPVVAPARDGPRRDPLGNPLLTGGIFYYPEGEAPSELLPETGDITATVEFTDVHGKTWDATFIASTEPAYPSPTAIQSTEWQSTRRIR